MVTDDRKMQKGKLEIPLCTDKYIDNMMKGASWRK